MGWLAEAWGKFRCWERTTEPRLSREQLGGARSVFEVLRTLEDGTPRASVKAKLDETIKALPQEGRQGALAFNGWLRDNKERLREAAAKSRARSDAASTGDKITVELLR